MTPASKQQQLLDWARGVDVEDADVEDAEEIFGAIPEGAIVANLGALLEILHDITP